MSEMRQDHEPARSRILNYEISDDGSAIFTIDSHAKAADIDETLVHLDYDEARRQSYKHTMLRYGINEWHLLGEDITFEDFAARYADDNDTDDRDRGLTELFDYFADEGRFSNTQVKVNLNIRVDSEYVFTIKPDEAIAQELNQLSDELYGLE